VDVTTLGAMTTHEVPDGSVLVVPLGSTEQHGPHLPLDTDVRIAEAIAERVVDRTERFVLGPTLPVGAAGEHAGFAGTLSIGTEALTTVIVELRRSLGPEFAALAIVNGHGGNLEALRSAEVTCAHEGRDLRVWSVRVPGGDAHAGRTETSLMLALAPDTVRLDRGEPGSTAPLADTIDDLRTGGVAAVSANGILGDPTGATAAEGDALLDDLVVAACATLSA